MYQFQVILAIIIAFIAVSLVNCTNDIPKDHRECNFLAKKFKRGLCPRCGSTTKLCDYGEFTEVICRRCGCTLKEFTNHKKHHLY